MISRARVRVCVRGESEAVAEISHRRQRRQIHVDGEWTDDGNETKDEDGWKDALRHTGSYPEVDNVWPRVSRRRWRMGVDKVRPDAYELT